MSQHRKPDQSADGQPPHEAEGSVKQPLNRNAWSAAEKLAILAEYEQYPRGDTRRGEVLRRAGVYSSLILKWRDQRDRGVLTPQNQPRAGRPAQPRDPAQEEIARLQRENARLQVELDKAQFIIAVQKKLAALLDAAGTPPNTDR